MPMIELSERQKTTVASAVTILATFVILVAVSGLLFLLGAFFSRFSGVFLPLGVAAVMAFVLHPYFLFLKERLRLPAALAIVVLFLSLLLPISGFAWFFGNLVVEQATGLVENTPAAIGKALKYSEGRWPKVFSYFEDQEIGSRAKEAVETHGASIVSSLQDWFSQGLSGAGAVFGLVFGWVGTIVTWAVLPVYLAFFLMADPKKSLEIDHMLPFLKSDTRENVVYLAREFVNILVAFFRGQLIIAFLQGALFAIGFSVVGLRYGLILGIMLGFLNIIPYLGNMVGLGIAIPLALAQQGGGPPLLGMVMLVFVAVQLIEGYILTPRIMGERTGLHPFVIIVAIFFWGSALGGISGMILAIPLTAFLVVFWRLAKEKYMRELV